MKLKISVAKSTQNSTLFFNKCIKARNLYSDNTTYEMDRQIFVDVIKPFLIDDIIPLINGLEEKKLLYLGKNFAMDVIRK